MKKITSHRPLHQNVWEVSNAPYPHTRDVKPLRNIGHNSVWLIQAFLTYRIKGASCFHLIISTFFPTTQTLINCDKNAGVGGHTPTPSPKESKTIGSLPEIWQNTQKFQSDPLRHSQVTVCNLIGKCWKVFLFNCIHCTKLLGGILEFSRHIWQVYWYDWDDSLKAR